MDRHGMGTLGRFPEFRDNIEGLPEGELSEADLITPDFLLAEDGRFTIYYAPFDGINRDARLAIVGLTPGWAQMKEAFAAAKGGFAEGLSDLDVLARAKETAAFAGSMRRNLVAMLDDLGVATKLGLDTCDDLFSDSAHLVHSTSALRYPVFRDGRNYSGTPDPLKQPIFAEYRDVIAAELANVDRALVLPLGKATTAIISDLITEDRINGERVLTGFPHPSGLNAHRPAQFEANRAAIASKVDDWFAV